jgi:hypothetical protein
MNNEYLVIAVLIIFLLIVWRGGTPADYDAGVHIGIVNDERKDDE